MNDDAAVDVCISYVEYTWYNQLQVVCIFYFIFQLAVVQMEEENWK